MAEVKDKVVTVESLAALHDYDESTYLKTSGALTTLGITATATELNYMDGVTSNVQTQLNAKAASSHTHSYLPLTGGTLTGNLAISKASPRITLQVTDTSLETRLYKNASTTADYGTFLADYMSDGTRDALMICRKNALANKLGISIASDDGSSNTLYYLYGEHNKPTASDVGALSLSGGTVSGDLNVTGILNVRSQQAFHYDTSTNAQTIGTNNATGGTIICCGSSAYLTVNGARLLTSAIVPRDGLTPNIGYSSGRYNCIYLTSSPNVSSDERLKRDINNLDTETLADFVNNLNVVSYNYLSDAEDAEARIGLIAQNVMEANEDMAKFFVEEGEDGYYSLRPSDMVFPLIATVQKLSKEVEELKAQLA